MLRVWVTAYNLHVATDATSWRIARFVFVRRSINLLQLRVINIRPESTLYSFHVCAVPISSDLHAVPNSTRAIVHEFVGPSEIPSTYQIANTELRIGV